MMVDIRDQPLNVGDRVYLLAFQSGSITKYEAFILGFTPQYVKLTYKRWKDDPGTYSNSKPKYIVKI